MFVDDWFSTSETIIGVKPCVKVISTCKYFRHEKIQQCPELVQIILLNKKKK